MATNPRCSLCTTGVRPLAFCSRHALALVNRTVTAADLARLDERAGSGPIREGRDGEPLE